MGISNPTRLAILGISLVLVSFLVADVIATAFSWNSSQTDISDEQISRLLNVHVFKDDANVMGR